jgi:hypothetical protein
MSNKLTLKSVLQFCAGILMLCINCSFQRFSVRGDYEGLIHIGQLIHQYQQNKQSPLTSKSLTTLEIQVLAWNRHKHSFVDISGIVDYPDFDRN